MKKIAQRLLALIPALGLITSSHGAFSFSSNDVPGELYWNYEGTHYAADHSVIGTYSTGSESTWVEAYSSVNVGNRSGTNEDGTYWVEVSQIEYFVEYC